MRKEDNVEYIWIIGIILFIAGFVLVGIEMILPGFGVPGISGVICLIGGILLTADSFEEGITITIVVIVILGIMLTIIMTLLSSKKAKLPLVLDEDLGESTGFINSSDLEYLVGKVGVAETDLRPAGKGDFEGIEFDVRSESQYIVKGTKIKIIYLKENVLIVKAV